MTGDFGLEVVFDNSFPKYVQDDQPSAETHYLARFFFDPNSIQMADFDDHILFWTLGEEGETVALLILQRWFGEYKLIVATFDDIGRLRFGSWTTLSDAVHLMEFEWFSASGPGTNDGQLLVFVDGIEQTRLDGLDNDSSRIDRILLGPSAGIDSGTVGTYYLDGFESWR